MNRDSGITELVGFLLILTLVLACTAVVTALFLPVYLEETEQKQNAEAFSSFISFNNDLATLCLAEEAGIQRKSILSGASIHQRSQLSLTHGEGISYRGVTYKEVLITYEIDNALADDFEISLSKRGIRLNNKAFTPLSFRLVTNPKDTTEQMEIDAERFWIEYTYLGTFVKDGVQYHIVSMRLA